MFSLDNILAYEKYLPVLTSTEVDALLVSRPSLLQLQDWGKRLASRDNELDAVFATAYQKQNIRYGKRK